MSDMRLNDMPTNWDVAIIGDDSAVLGTLELMHRGDSAIEVRVLPPGRDMQIRQFASISDAAQFVAEHDGDARAIYTTLNPFDITRIKNLGADDESITRRRWILIDCDPVRPTKTNSTDTEKRAACDVADNIFSYLTDVCEVPATAILRCDSGNGSHVLVCIDLPNDDASTDLIRRLLVHLAQRFDSASVTVDQSVFNASRITKLYGTWTRKGPNTAERPHRQSQVLSVPLQIEPVPLETLQEIAALTTAAASPAKAHDGPINHGLDRRTCMQLAAAYLQTQAPAIEGQNGDKRTYAMCCAVVIGHDLVGPDPGKDENDAYTVLQEFNARCRPTWSEKELRRKIRNARKYGNGPRGAKLVFREYKEGKRQGDVVADSQDNIRLGLALLGVSLSYDAFANVTMVTYRGDSRPIDDAIINRLWLQFDAEFHFRPPLEFFHIVLHDLARRNTVHPVREYLSRLTWDRVPRLDRWLVTYGGADENDYVLAVGPVVFIAAVRRVTIPGCKFDTILILESPQGKNKSKAVRVLCPNAAWFSDDLPLGTDAKLTIERTGGKFIIEASELQGFSNADIEKLKAFLSRGIDGPVRLSYARTPVEVARQFILIGTTNEMTQYLQDSTGNRRFWPVRINQFDVDALRRDRDQLWAEAVHREALNESIELPEHLWPHAAAEQDARRLIDPFEELLEENVNFESEAVLVSDLWNALGDAGRSRRKNDASRLAKIMQRHGFTRRKKVSVVPVLDGYEQRGDGTLERRTAWIRDGADPVEVFVEMTSGGSDVR